MLIKKMTHISVIAIVLILMVSTAFAAKLTINSDTQMDSLTIGDGVTDEVEVSDGNTITVNGDVTIGAGASGILTMLGSSQMVCSGTFTNNANGTINANTSRITFNGGDTQSINADGATLYDVVFSTGAKSIDGSLTIGNGLDAGGLNVTIAGGSTLTLDADSNTYISGGAWTLTGTLTPNATSTINYTSGIAQDVLAVTHGHLTHNGAGTLSLTTNLDCAVLTNTTGDFTPGTYAITAGGIVWTNGSITATPSGVWDIGASGVDINGGTFVATSGAFTCGGSWDMTGTGTFAAGTGTVDFDSTSLTITSDGKTFYDVAISEDASLADAMAFLVGGSLTVDATKTFDLGAYGLAGTSSAATMNNDGTVEADGSQTITLVNWDNTSGTTLINGTGGVTLTDFADSFHDLDIGGDDAIALGKDITVAGDMEVLTAGTTFNMATHSIDLSGGGTVTNSGTWGVPTSGTFTCLGNATFAGNNINFFNFSCEAASADLTFAATKTYQVDGTLTLDGQASGTKIDILSSTPGSAFNIQDDGDSENVQFVTVKDCTATTNPISATSSSLVSNVTNWIFSIISAIGGGDWSNAATWVGGVVPTPTNSVVMAGDVTLDVSPTVNNLTVTATKTLICGANDITVNGDSDINGIVTISTGTYDANGAFDAIGGTITFSGAGSLLLGGAINSGTLDINSGTVNYDLANAQTMLAGTYNNLTISGGAGTKTLGGAIVINSGLSIAEDTTLDVSATDYAISVAGDWSNSGTFTAQNGEVIFTGGAAQSLTPGTGSFYNLTISNTSETDTVTPDADLGVTNDLTLTDGIFKLDTNNPDVTIGHALSIELDAVWTAGTGTLIFNGNECTLSDANATPNNLGNVKVE